MKSLLSNRYLFKINSSRIVQNDMHLVLSREEALANQEIIQLSSSAVLRMIDKINGVDFKTKENKIKELKREIKQLKKDKKNKEKLKIKQKELKDLTFMEDYLCIVMDTKKDYDALIRHGFTINNIPYKRLLATSGGVKKSTVVFVSEKVHTDLYNWIHCERDLTKKFVPAKLEAYIALACSASIPVTTPKGVLVVHDIETKFKDSVIEVNGLGGGRPIVKEIDDYEVVLNACDGLGLMSPELADIWSLDVEEDYRISGACLRNAFCKGMIFTFDFHKFAREVAKTDQIKDVWGNTHNINDIDLILTTSMLKLWDSYSSIDDYLEKAQRNNHTFALTKVTPHKLDEEQTLNYQFLQSLELTDEDVDELCEPLLTEIEDVMNKDYRKTLLYLRGVDLKESTVLRPPYDFTTAMMLDPTMLNDPYVYSKIKHNIKNRIDTAKMGVIPVKGNFSIISGDPYILCEAMFGLEPKGLLKKGEFYSAFWNEKGVTKTVAMRAPMTSHNNIQICNMANREDVNEWYKYMNTVYILNAWDTTCAKLNGADMDGDTFFTTDNPVILRNVYPSKAIMCVQSASQKIIPKEKDFILANKRSFGNLVGTITNYATSMYSVIVNFKEGTPEWNELHYRILCMQDFQQNSIDMAKGIEYRPVPKEWYDWKTNVILPTDDEETIQRKQFNQSILANKKPYFMTYNYAKLKSEHTDYKRANDTVCRVLFKMDTDQLREKEDKTQKEADNYKIFAQQAPTNISPSLVNKIAWKIEKHFAQKSLFHMEQFDTSKLKNPNVKYSKQMYNKVVKIREEYGETVKKMISSTTKQKGVDVEAQNVVKEQLKQNFVDAVYEVCGSEEIACNILVDICYKDNKAKQLLWDCCAEQLIKNLIANGYDTLHVPTKDENGEFEYKSMKFTMREVDANEINW